LGEEAAQVNPEKQEVRTASGKKFFYDKLLVASGAAPLRPDIEGSRLRFVFTIRDLPDVRKIREFVKVRRTGRAVVAGAGPVGLELCDALHKLGFTITLVISSGRVFSTMLDQPSSALLEKNLTRKGVEVRKRTDITCIRPSGEVSLSSGETRMCDFVIFGKGVTPSLAFLAGSGIGIRQGVQVDEHQETNIPGIYAAGDVAETRDIVYGDSRVNALWPEAFEQGKVAAYNMASRPLPSEGSFSRNILRVFDTSILAAGTARADGPEVRCEDGPGFHHKLVLDQGILKGFIFVGELRNEGFYTNLLRKKVRLTFSTGSLLHGSYTHGHFMRNYAKS
jgi:NAD(P)H-nitrite reductase large subunit